MINKGADISQTVYRFENKNRKDAKYGTIESENRNERADKKDREERKADIDDGHG